AQGPEPVPLRHLGVVGGDLGVEPLVIAHPGSLPHPAVTSLEAYPPPMALHRWASGRSSSAGLSRVRASILSATPAVTPRISRSTTIQVTGGSSPPHIAERGPHGHAVMTPRPPPRS